MSDDRSFSRNQLPDEGTAPAASLLAGATPDLAPPSEFNDRPLNPALSASAPALSVTGPAKPPAAKTVDPVTAKHATLGRAIRHIASTLEGKQINYVPDEDNPGQVKEVV